MVVPGGSVDFYERGIPVNLTLTAPVLSRANLTHKSQTDKKNLAASYVNKKTISCAYIPPETHIMCILLAK